MLTVLQLGRGLAAMAVAAGHLTVMMSGPDAAGRAVFPFGSALQHGFLGVDFFFVLSGFIMLHAHERDIGRPDRLGAYAYKRFIRIYPIYWVYLTACIVGMLVVKSAYLQLGSGGGWASAFGLVRFSSVELPLRQAWSLFHEMAFYAVFALLLVNRLVGTIVIGAWMLGVALCFQYVPPDGETFLNVFSAAYNLNFLVGMLGYKLWKGLDEKGAVAALGAGLALLLYAYLDFSDDGNVIARMLIGVSFGLILPGAAALERCGSLRLAPALSLLGDASYSIYLLHTHLASYTIRALKGLGLAPADAPMLSAWIALLVAIGGGCAAYYGIERPLLRRLRRIPGRPRSAKRLPSTPPTRVTVQERGEFTFTQPSML